MKKAVFAFLLCLTNPFALTCDDYNKSFSLRELDGFINQKPDSCMADVKNYRSLLLASKINEANYQLSV